MKKMFLSVLSAFAMTWSASAFAATTPGGGDTGSSDQPTTYLCAPLAESPSTSPAVGLPRYEIQVQGTTITALEGLITGAGVFLPTATLPLVQDGSGWTNVEGNYVSYSTQISNHRIEISVMLRTNQSPGVSPVGVGLIILPPAPGPTAPENYQSDCNLLP